MNKCCKNCKWAKWDADTLGLVEIGGRCGYPVELMVKLPDAFLITSRGILPDDGQACPCFEAKSEGK